MKNYLLLKYLIAFITEYIFIFLTTTIFLFGACGKSFSDENVFVVDNVKVEGKVDLNFSREKYLNQAFLNSFEILMSKILLSEDLNKISNIKLKKIKKLVSSFQILDEKYSKSEYEGKIIILSAIDNLIKGGSGQAVQNMNILYNFPESRGLK